MKAEGHSLIPIIQRDLLKARKERSQLTAATLQVLIAAIDNAGAVAASRPVNNIGVGSTEMPRREVSEEEVQEIIKHEIDELMQVTQKLGQDQASYAEELHKRIKILENYLR